jgi:hypothetical protein
MEQHIIREEHYDLAFLAERALDQRRDFSVQERQYISLLKQTLHDADALIICLGGRAGRLGECVVGSALLEGVLQVVLFLRKCALPVYISVDKVAVQLFDQQLYQQRYWSEISVVAGTKPLTIDDMQHICTVDTQHVLMLDFHGAHDDMPYMVQRTFRQGDIVGMHTWLANVFRVGVRYYSRRGPLRRYIDCISDLFGIPYGAIEGKIVQPRLYLSTQEIASYGDLLKTLQINPPVFPVVCFFQSMVLAKCYERWDEVMHLMSRYVAQRIPQRPIDFIIACGPDTEQPAGFKKIDIIEWFQDFEREHENAHVHVIAISSLRELAIVTSQARLVLSNDTGPSHIAGALAVPVVVPYLPGDLYSMRVWSSSLWHHGVTADEQRYNYQELEASILWGRTEIIDSIAPARLFQTVLSILPDLVSSR